MAKPQIMTKSLHLRQRNLKVGARVSVHLQIVLEVSLYLVYQNYMEMLCKEYSELLNSEANASERFWELEKIVQVIFFRKKV